jgi:hypothetical protein
MKDLQNVIPSLHRLNEIGVEISIDDFGTGYSSLSYLTTLPISELKIDRSFVRDLGVTPQSSAVVTAIIALARSLGLRVIAEGVETLRQMESAAAAWAARSCRASCSAAGASRSRSSCGAGRPAAAQGALARRGRYDDLQRRWTAAPRQGRPGRGLGPAGGAPGARLERGSRQWTGAAQEGEPAARARRQPQRRAAAAAAPEATGQRLGERPADDVPVDVDARVLS